MSFSTVDATTAPSFDATDAARLIVLGLDGEFGAAVAVTYGVFRWELWPA